MTDPDAQLTILRIQRDAATDPALRAALDAAIAALEQAAGARNHTQHIGGYATIAAAIAGDFHGTLYVVGARAQSAQALLAGYLRWLASQCGQLPLRGVREQKSATDVLEISLDQVYTQLATTALVEREVFEGEALKRFDAQAYLAQHVGELLLPGQQRHYVQTPLLHVDQDNVLHALPDLKAGWRATDLEPLPTQALAEYARTFNVLRFRGPQLVTEAIAASLRLVLLGEPGSGKSTVLRYLALTLARAGLDDTFDLSGRLEGWSALGANGRLVPLFMPLLPLAQRLAQHPGRNGTAADLWAAIDAHLVDHGATAEVVAAIRAELARGHVLLLLDGLDEVAGDTSRRQVADAIQAFAAEQPQCRMVVACRVRAYEGEQNAAWQLRGWPTATLADWTPGQVRAFVSAWYAAAAEASRMPAAKRDEHTAALQRAVAERDDLRRLSVRPLLLTIMALVHLNDSRLPEDRVSLYARCMDILLGQWEIAGKDETVYGSMMQYIGLPDADVKSLRPLLARMAYMAQEASAPGDVGRLRRADLRVMVADALEQLKHPNPHEGAKRFLEYTDGRSGLLQASAAGDAYAFPHQTFQEYLAGLELISGVGFADRIMDRRGDDRWRGPILCGVGHSVSEGVLSVPYQLLNRMLHASGRDETQRQHDLIFAAEIAADVGWDRLERGGDEFTALRTELAKELAMAVEGTALSAAERVGAGVLLGQIGDLREGVCDLPPKMVPIAGGTFVIGNTPEEYQRIVEAETPRQLGEEAKGWYRDTVNEQPVVVASFEMAPYPVTNAQYALFVEEDAYNHDRPWWDDAGRSWLTGQRRRQPNAWHDERFGSVRPNHPVVGVSWYEATAFCRWLSQHRGYNPQGCRYMLPSEAEWEYAARGPERRPYPWGPAEPNGERANFDNMYDGTTAVGCLPRGATSEGVMDLAGNVWEWTRSEYRLYPYDPSDEREDVTQPTYKYFALRGGGWPHLPLAMRTSYREEYPPGLYITHLGFRLVRYPKVQSVSEESARDGAASDSGDWPAGGCKRARRLAPAASADRTFSQERGMDAQQVLQSACDLLAWMGPLIAGGALAQTGEHAADRASELLGRAWRALQGWLAHDDDAASDLRRLAKQPQNTSRQQLVAEAVAQLAARDAAVAAELETLARALADLTGSTPGRSHQVTISGNARVGQAIAGDVHGGITVGRMDLGDAGAAPSPARSAPSAAPAPAPRAADATLSADGVHFSYGHALLIGVGTYASSALSAPATATDAQRLAEMLRDEATAAYPEAQVRVLSGAEATREAILAALDTFPQQISDRRATAVVFFAGHGIQRPDGFYLLPYDYDPAQLAATAISAAQFHAKIGVLRQRAARLIVLLNCCHAGGVGGALLGEEDLADGGDAPPPAFYQPLVEGSGQIVISSSKPDQKSGARSDADPALTVFGAQLLAGLQGGVGGSGPGIGVLDLFSYLCTHVPQDARTISYLGQPLEQRPLLYASEVDQNFAIALRRGGAPATLGVEDQRESIRALAEVEIALAGYGSEAAAPPELVARRDRLLAQLERA